MSDIQYRLTVRTNAEIEIVEEIDFLDNERDGLGQEFYFEVEETIDRIQSNPLLFQIRYINFRIAFLEKFSYGVHYTIEGDNIFVHAVLHTSRNPR